MDSAEQTRGPGFPWWCRLREVAGSVLRIPWLRQALALLRRAFAEFRDDHCQQMAAAISYHVLFSLFPLAIMAIGIIGLITQNPNAQGTVTSTLLSALPLDSQGEQNFGKVIDSVSGGVGALGLLGLLGLIWSASGVMAAVRTSLNIAWDTDAKRPFIRGKIVDLLLVGAIYLVSGATIGLTIAANIIRRNATRLPDALHDLEPLTGAGARLIAIAAATALLFATFAFLYRVVPAVPTRIRGVWPGALAAAVGFEALQYGFSAYLSFFGHYNKVYGSLGAVIAFLFLVYLASMVFLFGAEIASEYPRLTAADSDTAGSGDGKPKSPPDDEKLSGRYQKPSGSGLQSRALAEVARTRPSSASPWLVFR